MTKAYADNTHSSGGTGHAANAARVHAQDGHTQPETGRVEVELGKPNAPGGYCRVCGGFCRLTSGVHDYQFIGEWRNGVTPMADGTAVVPGTIDELRRFVDAKREFYDSPQQVYTTNGRPLLPYLAEQQPAVKPQPDKPAQGQLDATGT